MQQLRKLVQSLSGRQRWSILAAALVVAGTLWGFTRWQRESAFRPLYTGLGAEDAGTVVQKLKQSAVDYRLGENGTTVLVPADKLAELRLQMAVEGLPKTGRLGFELFDKTNFGLTDFAEHVNYRRALEGELERSMSHLREVEQARVHLTFPRDSVFLEARQPAKASVMLQLRGGASLSEQNVQAVCNLVASAVEGLAPEAVTLLDTRGNLLNRPRRASDDELAASEATLDYRRQIERDLLLKIRSTLDPLLGPEKFQAVVSVDCDMASAELSEETYDAARSATLTSQKTEDTSGAFATSGLPGTASNLPRPTGAAAATPTGTSRRTESVTYQPSRVVRHTRQPQGGVKRVSVSVLVDHDLRWDGKPPNLRRVLAPPAPEKLKSIHDLVTGVAGFDQARGDVIVVETLPFDATLRAAPPELPGPSGAPSAQPPRGPWLPEQKLKVLVAGAAGGILLLAVAVWVLARRRRRPEPAAAPETAPALPAGAPEQGTDSLEAKIENKLADAQAKRLRLEQEALEAMKLPNINTKKSQVLAKHLREGITKDAANTAMVLRSWLDNK